jgi:hypothetical protein
VEKFFVFRSLQNGAISKPPVQGTEAENFINNKIDRFRIRVKAYLSVGLGNFRSSKKSVHRERKPQTNKFSQDAWYGIKG